MGVNVESYLDFRPDSDTAKELEAHEGNKLATISQLPADSLLYVGLNGNLFGGAEQLMNAAAAAAPQADAETQRKLESLQKALAEVKYRSVAFDFSLGEAESGLVRSVGIIEAAPVGKIREFARETAALMNVEDASGLQVEANYEAEAETIGDHKVDVHSVQISIDPNANPFGAQIEEFITLLGGPDGFQTRYAFWNDKYVQSIGGGPDAMAASLERIDGGKSNTTAEHRRELLGTPDVLVLVDVQRVLRAVLKGLDATPAFPFPIDQDLISGDDPAPSYIGFTLATEADAVHTKLQLPGSQVQYIVEFAVFARTLAQSLQGR
jgi:hypothetical protein